METEKHENNKLVIKNYSLNRQKWEVVKTFKHLNFPYDVK
jgi:hypothetical protein